MMCSQKSIKAFAVSQSRITILFLLLFSFLVAITFGICIYTRFMQKQEAVELSASYWNLEASILSLKENQRCTVAVYCIGLLNIWEPSFDLAGHSCFTFHFLWPSLGITKFSQILRCAYLCKSGKLSFQINKRKKTRNDIKDTIHI